MRSIARNIGAARTGKPRNHFFLGPGVYAQEFGDHLAFILGHDSAFARQRFALHHGFGKAETARIATGTTIRARQHLMCRVDAGVLVHVQFSVCQHQK
jgi:hypothetical protein